MGHVLSRHNFKNFQDMETVDGTLAMLVGGSFMVIEEIAYSLTGIFIALPWLIPILFPMAACFFFIVVSRLEEFTRLHSINFSASSTPQPHNTGG